MKIQANEKNNLVLLLFFLSFLIISVITFAYQPSEYPSWDAAAYLTTGQYFYGHEYLYDDVRPPVIPLIYGTLLEITQDLQVLRIFDIILRSLACAFVYIIARRHLSNISAFLLSLLSGITIIALRIPLYFSEFLALALMMVSLSEAIKLENKKPKLKNYTLLFLLASLAVLTRYPMLAFCAAILTVIAINWKTAWETRKDLAKGAAIAAIPLALWIVWNAILFGNLIKSSTNSFTSVSNEAFWVPWHHFVWSSNENIFIMLGLITPLVIYGGWLAFTNRRKIVPIAAILFLALITYTPAKITRYSYYFLFLSYFLAFYATEEILKKKWIQDAGFSKKVPAYFLILMVFVLLMLPNFYTNPPNENSVSKKMYDNGIEVRGITSEDDIIATFYSTQMAFSSQRKTYSLHEPACDYLKCPIYPYSWNKLNGCEKVNYVISGFARGDSCLTEYYVNKTSGLYVYAYTQE